MGVFRGYVWKTLADRYDFAVQLPSQCAGRKSSRSEEGKLVD